MKNSIFAFVFILICYSCTTEEDPVIEDYTGKWELVRMTGSIAGSETTGSDMDWQEYYILNGNGTFIKKRVEMNFTTELTGTYRIYNVPTATFPDEQSFTNIQMTYSNADNIIATCSSNRLQEDLYFTSTGSMHSTYNTCDGPGLEYRKTK